MDNAFVRCGTSPQAEAELLPKRSLNTASKNLLPIEIHWIKNRGRRLTASWNGSER
jgi:hypothetical protein